MQMFDAIVVTDSPFSGFGAILERDNKAIQNFEEVWRQAAARFADVFHEKPVADEQDIQLIESTIDSMWSQDWNPKNGDIALFTRDFGVITTKVFASYLKTKLVFRSETELLHLSCWWPRIGVEVFPFHKIYKRLSEPDGESLTFFYEGVKNRVLEGP